MSCGSPHHWTLCPYSGGNHGLMCFAQQSGKFKEIIAFQIQQFICQHEFTTTHRATNIFDPGNKLPIQSRGDLVNGLVS